MKLLEDAAKSWLRESGLPVPPGGAASSVEEARRLAGDLGGAVAVKALVAAGRRGKSGGVKLAKDPNEAADAAAQILGATIAGQTVDKLYLERRVDIEAEFYLSFAFGDLAPRALASRAGGVEIEQTFASDPGAIATYDVDPRKGLMQWHGNQLWDQAGVESRLIPKLGLLTAKLYRAFVAADAVMLELNPIALTRDGELSLVGAMMEIDDYARARQPQWSKLTDASPSTGRQLNARELAVEAANAKYPGGAVRYSELDGDIGLMVAGGGASLLQHDMILALGGRPANHSDISPTPTLDKPAAVFDAIFSNPNVRGLLVGYNYLQMAPCDTIIEALLSSIDRNKVDPSRFPIVIRLFGPKEEAARALAASRPGIQYLPSNAALADGCKAIVAAVERVTQAEKAI